MKKPILITTIIGGTITRLITVLFSTYLVLWIQSFKGITPEQAKDIYFTMMMISVVVSCIVLPILGKFIDNSPAIRLAPWAFLARCIFTFFFYLLNAPNSIYAYTVCVCIVVSTLCENNLIDSVFAKNLSKATRGMLFGMQMFFCNLGILLFSLAGGWLYDSFESKSGPFVLIGFMDFFYAVAVAFMVWKYKW